jgi:2-oxoglutarate ferredoxin oxidoreductase subunit gamma
MHESVIMSGFGGQGILLMGQLLCYAGMHEGLKVTWMPSYGPEMRGGTANCTVMLSSSRVGSPVTRHPSSLVAMNKASLRKFEAAIQAGGFLVINSSLVDRDSLRPDLTVVKVPANQIAEEAGTLQASNMAALGAYVAGRRVVSLESIVLALRQMIPEHRQELMAANEEALRRGSALTTDQIGATEERDGEDRHR